MKTQKQIQNYMQNRPEVDTAFGYMEEEKIHLILTVENEVSWNFENHVKNPQDYSVIGKIFCHYLFPFSKKTNLEKKISFKTVETETLRRQLLTWNSMRYVASFGKKMIRVKTNPEMNHLISQNRRNILVTSLYLVEDGCHINALYDTIANILLLEESMEENLKYLYELENESYPLFEVKEDQTIKIDYNALKKEPLPAYLAYDLDMINRENKEALKRGIYSFLEKKQQEGMLEQLKEKGFTKTLKSLKKRIYTKKNL